MMNPSSRTNSKKRAEQRNLESPQQVYSAALDLLSYRDYSESQLKSRLRRKGAQEEDTEASLEKLREYGLINEERYGQRAMEAWCRRGAYGRLHLQADLQRRGLAPALVQELVRSLDPELEQDFAEAASELFIKKNKRKIETSLEAGDRKIYAAAARFMAARGFSGQYTRILLAKLHLDDDI